MFYPIIRTHTVKLLWSFVSYFFERFKWKKLNYGKILNFLPGCYRQRQPYWKKTTNSISAVNHYRIEIFTWFKLHINCIYVFYASSDQIFFILIREKWDCFKSLILCKGEFFAIKYSTKIFYQRYWKMALKKPSLSSWVDICQISKLYDENCMSSRGNQFKRGKMRNGNRLGLGWGWHILSYKFLALT